MKLVTSKDAANGPGKRQTSGANAKNDNTKVAAEIKGKLKEVAKLTLETDRINQKVKGHILTIHDLLRKLARDD